MARKTPRVRVTPLVPQYINENTVTTLLMKAVNRTFKYLVVVHKPYPESLKFRPPISDFCG
jgi:hypothetical protein